MALSGQRTWYVGTTKWTAVSIWATGTVTAAGALRRQTAALGTLTVGNERVFVCIVAGTTHATTEPTWVLTKGAKTTDNTVTWQECTGQDGVNGDTTNCKNWNNAKNLAVVLGDIIQDIASTTLFICTTAGTAGNGAEPTWNTTAGATTADNTVTWTSLGAKGNFGAWAAPHARLKNAAISTWAAAGDTVYVSNNHAETQSATITYTTIGSAALPLKIYSINDSAVPPTVFLAGASVTSTTNILLTPNNYIDGISFTAGSGAGNNTINVNTGGAGTLILNNCPLTLATTGGASAQFKIGSAGDSDSIVYINNGSFTFGGSSQTIEFEAGLAYIVGGSVAASGTVPTNVFKSAGSGAFAAGGALTVRDCDLSAITTNIVSATFGSQVTDQFLFENCKLGGGVTLGSGTFPSFSAGSIRFHNCDSSGTSYRLYYANYLGTLQQETTIIRTGGASDGTTGVSWNIASTANTQFYFPFISEEIAVWNDATGSSKTLTIEINSGGTLTNGDVWVEAEYLGNASFPIATLISSRKASILTSSTNITSSAASWAGSLAGSTTQKLQVTFTPNMKGPIKARVYVGKASQTVYIDPLITLS